MTLYTQETNLGNALWVETVETPWPWQTTGPSVPGSKVPHLSVADELFIAAVVNTPCPLRPWGRSRNWPDSFRSRAPRSIVWADGRRKG